MKDAASILRSLGSGLNKCNDDVRGKLNVTPDFKVKQWSSYRCLESFYADNKSVLNAPKDLTLTGFEQLDEVDLVTLADGLSHIITTLRDNEVCGRNSGNVIFARMVYRTIRSQLRGVLGRVRCEIAIRNISSVSNNAD